ncbi:GntR family transcriptional regulator [Paracoccus benzoatiresistens]|uniref:GntR family transcriptional regulator n=1 Tax=Paracoccus benzoatiresistens TaxID=2997341 RepID=A0ABT4J6A0_9RHOB|nr:GntR family transcriptional regulator [Paracoccus sp. EF6]MCZ0962650.1 GntR family transcriptional regulator [Paracoccus sp. EF6]
MKHKPEDTLAVKIARSLADRIITGTIPPGTPLRQDHIATEFGASHVPVREAFRHLEAQGLAVSEPRRGMRVTSFDVEELHEVAAMRASLEVLALRHAAPKITLAMLDAAEEATRAADASREVREWEAANRRFHRLILTPCAMPRLLSTIDGLHMASARFLFAAWRTEWEAQTDHEHRAILAALRRGQTDVACTILSKHVSRPGRRNVQNSDGRSNRYVILG